MDDVCVYHIRQHRHRDKSSSSRPLIVHHSGQHRIRIASDLSLTIGLHIVVTVRYHHSTHRRSSRAHADHRYRTFTDALILIAASLSSRIGGAPLNTALIATVTPSPLPVTDHPSSPGHATPAHCFCLSPAPTASLSPAPPPSLVTIAARNASPGIAFVPVPLTPPFGSHRSFASPATLHRRRHRTLPDA